jgi:hypothetical protein
MDHDSFNLFILVERFYRLVNFGLESEFGARYGPSDEVRTIKANSATFKTFQQHTATTTSRLMGLELGQGV